MSDDRLLNLLAELASEARDLGCTEADLRAVDLTTEWLVIRNGRLETETPTYDKGVGVRVRIGPSAGFAATPNRDAKSIRAAIVAATSMARETKSLAHTNLPIADPSVQTGSFTTAMPGGDPFQVPLDLRIERLKSIEETLRSDERIVVSRASQTLLKRRTRLANMHGTRIDQTIVLHAAGMQAVAQVDDQLQQRSYPKDFEGNLLQGGEEIFDRIALGDHAERVREEAIALCYAPPCPEARKTLLLDGAQMSLQIHESCGHPTEGDRVLREELSLAGSSFLTPDKMAAGFKYGSEEVNLVASTKTPGGPGTFAWDDEGTPAGEVDLVRKGRFKGYLTSRATSDRLGCAPIAACRAQSWDLEPIVRMVNINLEPGSGGSLEDMIAATDDGILMSANRSWSIDDHRLNFQFGCELAREIKGGKLGQIYRNPVYTGITPEFWGSCDMVGGPQSWNMWGWFYCGKGDPMQLMHVGHGTPPARFQNVQVRSS
jgi:TldD protein